MIKLAVWDESANRNKVQKLTLNPTKTKKLIIYFRQSRPPSQPRTGPSPLWSITLDITLGNSWGHQHQTQQHGHFWQVLKKNSSQSNCWWPSASPWHSMLTQSITVCYAGSSVADKMAIQRFLNTGPKKNKKQHLITGKHWEKNFVRQGRL